jgi:hypothetical protein
MSLASIVCCQVDSLRRADHSSRGVLPSDVCLECDRENLDKSRPWPPKGFCACNIKSAVRKTTNQSPPDVRRVGHIYLTL